MTVPTRPRVLWAAILLALAACSAPPSHYTRLWPEGHTGLPLIGTSTEDGVVILATPGLAIGDRFEIQFPHGNSMVVDWGVVDRLNDVLAVVRPQTARLREGRLAASPPDDREPLYLSVRDGIDEPEMRPVERWREGEYGDWLLVDDVGDRASFAAAQRGAGVYVKRDGRWEIVGVLAGLVAVDAADDDEVALGYIGLRELARILPERVPYFERKIYPLRPDFEFGVPLQPGDKERLLPEEQGAADAADAAPPVAPAPPAPSAPKPSAPR